MAQDVVELTKRFIDVVDAQVLQLNICQAKSIYQRLAVRNLAGGKIDSDKAAVVQR